MIRIAYLHYRLSVSGLLLWAQMVGAQPFVPGQSYFGANHYTEYIAGNLPIIISAPHGGLLTPSSIPDRNCSGCSTINDLNTQELVRSIADAIHNRTGCYPHIIINHLHRRKLDANRDLPEAALGNPLATQAWRDFHDFIDAAENSVTDQFGKGFYIDLHGHAHTIQRLELGYLLRKTELTYNDQTLNTLQWIDSSSIRHLVCLNVGGLTHTQLLRGPNSLGSMLAAKGYPAVPSASDPFPQPADSYFDGGYNTARHSAYAGGMIDGVQIECNKTGVRDSLPNIKRFADSLATTLVQYLHQHMFGTLEQDLCALETQNPGNPDPYGISLFPNPFCDEFHLQHQFAGHTLTVEMFDMYGNFIRKLTADPAVDYTVRFKFTQSMYLVFRENNAVLATRLLYYCR